MQSLFVNIKKIHKLTYSMLQFAAIFHNDCLHAHVAVKIYFALTQLTKRGEERLKKHLKKCHFID